MGNQRKRLFLPLCSAAAFTAYNTAGSVRGIVPGMNAAAVNFTAVIYIKHLTVIVHQPYNAAGIRASSRSPKLTDRRPVDTLSDDCILL